MNKQVADVVADAPAPSPEFLLRLSEDAKCCALLSAHIQSVDQRLRVVAEAAQDALQKTLLNVRQLDEKDGEGSVNEIENLVIDATDFLQNCDIVVQYIAMVERFARLACDEFEFLQQAHQIEQDKWQPPLAGLFMDSYHSAEQRDLHRQFFGMTDTDGPDEPEEEIELF